MFSILATALLASLACSDASSVDPAGESTSNFVRLSVSPSSAQHVLGDSVMFVAYGHLANGDSVATPATWTSGIGTISSAGAYVAAHAGVDSVRAQSTDQPTLSDVATISVVDTASMNRSSAVRRLTQVVLTPATVSLLPGATAQFTATGTWVDGTTGPLGVTYVITGGTITSGGLYTAGAAPGTYHVIATQTGGYRADTSVVTITPAAVTVSSFAISPKSASLATGGTQQFSVSAKMSDGSTTAPAATYTATGGTITAAGLYTAGGSAGTFRVIAAQVGGSRADTSVVTLTAPTVTPSASTLRALATARGFTIGAAVRDSAFNNDATYRQTLAKQFNSVVPEDATDFWPIHPGATQYNFGPADAIVAFAQANGMAFHGHHLAWYNWIPTWVTGGGYTNAQLSNILKDHITTVVGHFRGKAASWDVANEVIDDQSCFNGTCTLRQSFWLTHLGPAFIDSAFVWARQADPGAKLYLNDFRTETANNKADAVLALAQGLKSRGIPIDGVGFQVHILPQYFGVPTSTALQSNFQRFANAGFDIRITEMDSQIPDTGGATDLATQATIYNNVLDACLKVTRCKEMTMWGFTDKYSWVPGSFPGYGRALPFDLNYQPKPAFNALLSRLGTP